eukprot:6040511-Amphidinium_carterae.1
MSRGGAGGGGGCNRKTQNETKLVLIGYYTDYKNMSSYCEILSCGELQSDHLNLQIASAKVLAVPSPIKNASITE